MEIGVNIELSLCVFNNRGAIEPGLIVRIYVSKQVSTIAEVNIIDNDWPIKPAVLEVYEAVKDGITDLEIAILCVVATGCKLNPCIELASRNVQALREMRGVKTAILERAPIESDVTFESGK